MDEGWHPVCLGSGEESVKERRSPAETLYATVTPQELNPDTKSCGTSGTHWDQGDVSVS